MPPTPCPSNIPNRLQSGLPPNPWAWQNAVSWFSFLKPGTPMWVSTAACTAARLNLIAWLRGRHGLNRWHALAASLTTGGSMTAPTACTGSCGPPQAPGMCVEQAGPARVVLLGPQICLVEYKLLGPASISSWSQVLESFTLPGMGSPTAVLRGQTRLPGMYRGQ